MKTILFLLAFDLIGIVCFTNFILQIRYQEEGMIIIVIQEFFIIQILFCATVLFIYRKSLTPKVKLFFRVHLFMPLLVGIALIFSWDYLFDTWIFDYVTSRSVR